MNRLDLYIFRQSAVPFVLILLCTTAVVWLTQVLQRIDFMVEDGGSLLAFVKITVLLIPFLVAVITPFALLGAVLYTLNVLASDNELPVMAAAGASRARLARPILMLAALASAFVFVINVDLQPRSYRVLKSMIYDARSDVATAFIRSKIFTKVMDGINVYAEEVRPGDQYVGLLIHDERKPGAPVTYTAERGLFQVTRNGPRLLLARGTVQQIDAETGSVEILRFIETSVDMATFSTDSDVRNLDSSERYVSELLNPDLSNPYDAYHEGRFLSVGHSRLATPLYPIAFATFALMMMLRAPAARKGHGRLLMITLAGAVGIRTVGYVIQGAAADASYLNPLQYVWPSVVIVACTIPLVGKFWTVRRKTSAELKDAMARVPGTEPAT